MRTLLVEDDLVASTLLAQVLRASGHEVDSCTTVEGAWGLFEEYGHRLVLLDWLLDGSDGLEFCRRVRATPGGDGVVVVVVTGRDGPEHLRQVLEAGADDYIRKPVDVDLLQIRIAVAERQVELAIDRGRVKDQLLHDAMHDALTGLPNRNLLIARLESCIARRIRRDDYEFAVMFLDLDRFKVLNDSMGHSSGDQLLREFAVRLRDCLRPQDLVARMGGDEFAILLDDLRHTSDATRVAGRINAALELPFDIGGNEVFSSTSIGIASSRTGYESADQLLRDADTAMYRAKAQGPALHAIFDRAMHERAVSRMRIETDLRMGLNRGEFRLVFQPIVALATREVVGLEALLRWDHPERGVVAPDDFIRIAEETGLIVALGDWVLEEACRRLAGWRARFPARSLRMSVNLSGRQLLDRGLPQRVADILARTGVPTSALCLEITENVFIEGDALPLRVLQDLKALRVELQMDDFGTGYSSLAYLHRLPIDTLKIDRSFVGKLGERTHGAIVRGIVDLAKTLGLDAVAEGVETEGQLRALEATPCRYGQGFLFSRPLEPDAVDEFLS